MTQMKTSNIGARIKSNISKAILNNILVRCDSEEEALKIFEIAKNNIYAPEYSNDKFGGLVYYGYVDHSFIYERANSHEELHDKLCKRFKQSTVNVISYDNFMTHIGVNNKYPKKKLIL